MNEGDVSIGFLHPGHYSSCFADSLTDLLFYDAATNRRIVGHSWGRIAKQTGAGGIAQGRNEIAGAFLDQSKAEWLAMIDTDMGFAHDSIERLLDVADPVERPVVGALCFACKTDGNGPWGSLRYRATPTIYDYIAATEDHPEAGFLARMNYEPDTVTACSATGAAFLLIHRSAFELVAEKYGRVWFDPIRDGKSVYSEDLSFCVRLAAVDVPVHVHAGVKTTHDKGALALDEATFAMIEHGRHLYTSKT